MNLYQLLVFVHVLGGIGIFVAMGIEAVALGSLRLAGTRADARVALRPLALSMRLGPAAMLTTLASGMWMAALGFARGAWIPSALVGVVAMAIVGAVLSLRPSRRLRVALAAEGGPDGRDAFRSSTSSAALVASLRLRIAIGVGILGLMTLKPPDAATSSIILAAAFLAGLVANIVSALRRPPLTETSEA